VAYCQAEHTASNTSPALSCPANETAPLPSFQKQHAKPTSAGVPPSSTSHNTYRCQLKYSTSGQHSGTHTVLLLLHWLLLCISCPNQPCKNSREQRLPNPSCMLLVATQKPWPLLLQTHHHCCASATAA
jgi:hypothetical protein